MSSTWRIRGGAVLRGSIRVPSDLHIGQEALLWAALAEGHSQLSLSLRAEHRALIGALRALGVGIAEVVDGVHVAGVGLRGLSLPRGALDAGESASTVELLAALLAGQQFGTRIEARGAALSHSLRTLLPPLRERGAQIAGRTGDEGSLTAPVAVAPLLADEQLAPVEIEIPSGDASTKRALLISGLYTRGVTAINEGLLSRDHTERALLALGAPLQTLGPLTLLDTSDAAPRWGGFHWAIPGDFSLAAYVIAAALAIPGSDVVIDGVGLNRSRTAFLDALRHTGADIDLTPKGDCAGDEPVGEIHVRASRLAGTKALGELAQRLLDDVPAYAALTAASRGRIALRDAGALRLSSGALLKQCAQLLRAFGAECTEYEDGLDVDRPTVLCAATVAAELAAPLKLLGLVLGLCAEGETRILHAHHLDALYPGLLGALRTLGAQIEVEEVHKEV
jgi:3-phosphoshikimate 1-carboxyvinyltransferase